MRRFLKSSNFPVDRGSLEILPLWIAYIAKKLGFSVLCTWCMSSHSGRGDMPQIFLIQKHFLPLLCLYLHACKSLQCQGAEETPHYFQVSILLTLNLLFQLVESKYMLPPRRKHNTFQRLFKYGLKCYLLLNGWVTHPYLLLIAETGDSLMHSSFWRYSTEVPNCTYFYHIALRILLLGSKLYWTNQMHVGCKPWNQKPHTGSQERHKISLFLTSDEKKGRSYSITE